MLNTKILIVILVHKQFSFIKSDLSYFILSYSNVILSEGVAFNVLNCNKSKITHYLIDYLSALLGLFELKKASYKILVNLRLIKSSVSTLILCRVGKTSDKYIKAGSR